MGKGQKHSSVKKKSNLLAAQYQPKFDVARERKKPHLVALLFCHYFSLDAEGRSNANGCFDRIFVDPTTKLTGQFTLVVRTYETRDSGLTVTFLNPKNQAVAAVIFDPPAKLPTNKPMHVHAYGPVNFAVEAEGVYWVDVSYRGKTLGGESLTIEFRKPEEDQGEHKSN
jgi:hypothetical protein